MYQVIGGNDLQDHHVKISNRRGGFDSAPGVYAGISAPLIHKQVVETAMGKIRNNCKVGKKLATLAMTSTLHIVCWPGVPGEFQCDLEYPECTTPTIMWDPYVSYAYYGRQTVNVYKKTTLILPTLMPAWMVLAHELGHFWHYTVQPNWFRYALKNDYSDLDRQNLKDHENPMQEAAGFMVRQHYGDVPGVLVTKGGETMATGDHMKPVRHANVAFCATPSPGLKTAVSSFKIEYNRLKDEYYRQKQASKGALMPGTVVIPACDYCKKNDFTSVVKRNIHMLRCPNKP